MYLYASSMIKVSSHSYYFRYSSRKYTKNIKPKNDVSIHWCARISFVPLSVASVYAPSVNTLIRASTKLPYVFNFCIVIIYLILGSSDVIPYEFKCLLYFSFRFIRQVFLVYPQSPFLCYPETL
jgi:hypothetical protein